MTANWDRARAVADAVLYEGYLLYPYRATSGKNQSRWQFGVLGPPGAAEAGIGEADSLSTQFLVSADAVNLVVRFLHLQHRGAERDTGGGRYQPVDELSTPAGTWLSWDEAVERESWFGPLELTTPFKQWTLPVVAPAGTDVELVSGGRLVRTRQELRAELTVRVEPDDGVDRVSVTVRNTGAAAGGRATGKDRALARSLIGTHMIAEAVGGEFISLLEPPEHAAAAAARCRQHRCFPVLAGRPGEHDLLLISPIILYDYPEIAEQSAGALYDCTEIDELLTLRVMTMTEEEKAQARATDPLAAQIIDRCDAMSPEALQRLHGVLRDPHAGESAGGPGLVPDIPDGLNWWDPVADNAVHPERDAVLVNGVRLARGSRVRLHPARRADAHDLFFAGKTARVTSVHQDVDGDYHVGVVLDEDPAADLHDWYGRYLYFSPDEVEPLDTTTERNSTWTS
ncbi:MAG: hypothetical protein QJR12_07825 [Mycobacterium sp.]|uniref:hypothetical protein n=1 Tax=Mycobacterium sp. TaxID=1785 RepID=UPI002631A53C|nr:hypothetical protein [Mycobacterium sp.]MDI3314177.1 hypothetical protein [Mycobacterium sp.]